MVRQGGLEPATNALKGHCSTTELLAHNLLTYLLYNMFVKFLTYFYNKSLMARHNGFEPLALRLGGARSILLS